MLVGASIWCIYLGVTLVEGLQTESWPSVDGVIVSSNAKRIDHDKERYVIDVEYKYSVNEKHFTGTEISSSNKMLTKSEKENSLERYVSGKSVKVYYDPDSHQNAYLVTGADIGIYILLLACLGMVGFSAYSLRKLVKN